jgi:hypothetical protein
VGCDVQVTELQWYATRARPTAIAPDVCGVQAPRSSYLPFRGMHQFDSDSIPSARA